MTETIRSNVTAIEWDYRTDRAAQCCEETFAPCGSRNLSPDTLVGFQYPVRPNDGTFIPVSDFTVLSYGQKYFRDVIVDKLDQNTFTSVSRAVFSSHFGNHDVLLTSRMETITGIRFPSDVQLCCTVLRDMMIYTPENPEDLIDYIRQKDRLYAQQQSLKFPCLCIVVLPPARSNHAQALRLRNATYATEIASRLIHMHDVDLQPPSHIVPK